MDTEKTNGANEVGDESNPVGRGLRSPGYTSTTIKEALEKTKKLRDYGPARKPIAIDAALKVLGYSPRSGGGMQLVASMKKYGFLEDSGSTDTRAVRVSDLANSILLDARPSSPERDSLIRKAALTPKLNAEIRERWPHGLPDDSTIRYWLASERAFNEKYIPAYLKALRETFEYAKLDSAPDTGDDSDEAEFEDQNIADHIDDRQENQKQNRRAETSVREFLFPLIGGVAVLRVPHPMGPENYNLLKAIIDATRAALIGPQTPPNPLEPMSPYSDEAVASRRAREFKE